MTLPTLIARDQARYLKIEQCSSHRESQDGSFFVQGSSIRKSYRYTVVCDTILAVRKLIVYESSQTLVYRRRKVQLGMRSFVAPFERG